MSPFRSSFLVRSTKAAATGRVDLEHVARQHLGAADVGQRLDPAVGAHHAVDARRAALATGQAESRMYPAIGQDAGRHRLQKAHAPHAAAASTEEIIGLGRPLTGSGARVALSNSFAFGGSNVVLAFRKVDAA